MYEIEDIDRKNNELLSLLKNFFDKYYSFGMMIKRKNYLNVEISPIYRFYCLFRNDHSEENKNNLLKAYNDFEKFINDLKSSYSLPDKDSVSSPWKKMVSGKVNELWHVYNEIKNKEQNS